MINKFIIVAPSYNPNSGGVVVLHKLCHILNNLGYEAYLYPYITNHVISYDGVQKYCRAIFARKLKKFLLSKDLVTPVISKTTTLHKLDDCVVIYPEIVAGNPLNAKNVVRWFLHHPGYHTGRIEYGVGELYFKYGAYFSGLYLHGSKMSEKILNITHYPLHLYNSDNLNNNRSGTAYCIRKGAGRKVIHDLNNSILIDGKSHEEISRIFKSVKTFISYDLYTAYSWFAALCGCDSIVVPEDNISIDNWQPNEYDRAGIAYGFDKIIEARLSIEVLKQRFINEELTSINNVIDAVNEMNAFFKNI